ncbi:GFA family protein [Kangiella marina]|uniref:GFA family protein n=1 Tax=Kangiella marina TaxID=1079178 RepID=A0ABP8IE60_9GAMM
MSTISLKTQCLCKKVSINVAETKPHVDSCHCSMCRKWSGGPFLAIDCGTEVNFEGHEHIKVFSSSEWAERGFCSNCGTHLFYRLKEANQYIMPAGLFDSLDGLESAEFTTQIFIDEKPRYYDFVNKTKMMTGEEVFAAFAGDK